MAVQLVARMALSMSLGAPTMLRAMLCCLGSARYQMSGTPHLYYAMYRFFKSNFNFASQNLGYLG